MDNKCYKKIEGLIKELNAPYSLLKMVCFTGPRPKKMFDDQTLAYNPDAWLTFDYDIYAVIKTICKYSPEQPTFISGGAQGVDQAAFRAVDRAKETYACVENILFKPFENHGNNWSKKGLFSQEEYAALQKKADNIVVVNHNPRENIAKQLDKRNRAMVDTSSLVIGVFDAEKDWRTETHSGTANCLRYAESSGTAILLLKFRRGSANQSLSIIDVELISNIKTERKG